MSQQSWHRAQAQNPNLEPYEIEHHQRQARLLADPDGFYGGDGDVVRTLAEAAELLDDDDLRIIDDATLSGLFARIDAARDQVEAELYRRKRRTRR